MTRAGIFPYVRLGLSKDALQGEVAVVTGSGRGIGREIARAFASLGAAVVVAELEETGAEVQAEIEESGGRAIFTKVDVSNETSVRALFQVTLQTCGPATILVNNAILCPVASVMEMEVSEWDRVMAVNLRGAFLTCRAFLPGMLEDGRGTILNLISTEAMPYLSAYIASKQGLAAFSQSLAAEVGERGVRVIAFGPGFVATPGLREAADGLAPHLGMGPGEFLGMSVHAAYPGAMPARDAGIAAACLVIKFGDEYHGEIVTGYTVLERAGYISAGSGVLEEAIASKESIETKGEALYSSREHTKNLANHLIQVLDETEEEFRKLPVFVRPLAKSGFKSKADMSIGDWKRAIQILSNSLQGSLLVETEDTRRMLGSLERYYREVPEETARFIKDSQLLSAVIATSRERVLLIQQLRESLRGIHIKDQN